MTARIALRRVKWKRPPTQDDRDRAAAQAKWWAVTFERGDEWLILHPTRDEPWLRPLAPEGYKEVLG